MNQSTTGPGRETGELKPLSFRLHESEIRRLKERCEQLGTRHTVHVRNLVLRDIQKPSLSPPSGVKEDVAIAGPGTVGKDPDCQGRLAEALSLLKFYDDLYKANDQYLAKNEALLQEVLENEAKVKRIAELVENIE